MSRQVLRQTINPDEVDAVVLRALNIPVRYTLRFRTTGTEIEVDLIPGQKIKVTGLASHLDVQIDEIDPALPGGGLQLVPKSAA